MMNFEKKARLISICITVAVTVAVILLLIFLYLKNTGEEPRVWPPEDTSELLLEGEYVKYGDEYQSDIDEIEAASESSIEEVAPAVEPVVADAPVPTPAPTPDPVPVEEAPLITSKVESAMKVKEQPKPKQTVLTKEELARIEREKRQKEASERINNRVSFSKSTSGSSSSSSSEAHGQSGTPTGNSNTGAIYGHPGANLAGRTLASWTHPKSSAIGSIKINIRVNRKGEVISAEYQNGIGTAASLKETRESCIRAALKSKFSVDEDAPAEQPGSIIYTFE